MGVVVLLVVGGLLGSLIGGILTGNEAYWIALAVALPILLTLGGIFGSMGAKQAKQTGQPLRQGIISTIPGVRPTPLQQPVLNPVSAAQPSAGMVLNGEVVAAPDRPRTPGWWRIVRVLAIAAGAVLVLLPSHQVVGWVVSDIAAGRPFDGRDMRTGLHQQDAFDSIADVMGGTEVVSINFYDSYVLVAAPSSPGAPTVDRFQWQHGVATREGPDFTQPDDLEAALFDAGDIDLSIVADLVRESVADAQLEGLDAVYPSIRRFADEEPEIGIALTGAYFDAYYEYSVTGELLRRSGTAFD